MSYAGERRLRELTLLRSFGEDEVAVVLRVVSIYNDERLPREHH